MRRQRRRKVNRAGALSAIKAPDGFWPQRIHIDSFAAVAPARSDGNGDADVLAAEFLFAGGGLRHTRDAAVGDDALNLRAAGVTQFFRDQRGGGFRHVHGLLFQRLAYPHAASIDHRANANFR